ncbi:uncharacterized protein LOC126304753 [Schistocerca gregaria]|uniref:uncharacterized protein LOC126304753 n=1 Tax=Schistocerca gregaria TaxID=7010 RepID=UPI00211DDE72|nr:uncharacterized protein LOC126304753 [Schistocerca gregaria]
MFKRNKQKYIVRTNVDIQKVENLSTCCAIGDNIFVQISRGLKGSRVVQSEPVICRSHAEVIISKDFEWDSEHFRDIKTGTFDSKILTVRLKYQPRNSSKSKTIGLIKLNSSVLCSHVNCLASGIMSLSHHKKILKTSISMTIQTRWLKVGHEFVKDLFEPYKNNESSHKPDRSNGCSEPIVPAIEKLGSPVKNKNSESPSSANAQLAAHSNSDNVIQNEKGILSISNLDKFICQSCNSSVNFECSNTSSGSNETLGFDHALSKMASTSVNSKSTSNLPSLPVKFLTTLCHSKSQNYSHKAGLSYDTSIDLQIHESLSKEDRTSLLPEAAKKSKEFLEQKITCINDKEDANNISEFEDLSKVGANNTGSVANVNFDPLLDQEKKRRGSTMEDISLNAVAMLDHRIKHRKCLFCGCDFCGSSSRGNSVKSFNDLYDSYHAKASHQYRISMAKDLISILTVDRHSSSIMWIMFATCVIFGCYFTLGSDYFYLGLSASRVH